jgi:hypothetical protein
MRFTRRRLLQTGLALAASGAGLASFVYWRRRSPGYRRQQIIEHLNEVFAYLQPNPQGTAQFVDLYLRHYDPDPWSGTMRFVERTFLLSTDYFQSGQPPAGPVRFVQLYHRYLSPCYNPLVQPG